MTFDESFAQVTELLKWVSGCRRQRWRCVETILRLVPKTTLTPALALTRGGRRLAMQRLIRLFTLNHNAVHAPLSRQIVVKCGSV
jgi:hypothetical protein